MLKNWLSLLTRQTPLITPVFSFASIGSRSTRNNKADLILRNYFNKRSQMSNQQILSLIQRIKNVRVTRSFFNDHRWIHLNVIIQKSLKSFSIEEKIKIMHGLSKLKMYNDLFNAIFDQLINTQHKLSANQKALLIYYMAKSQKLRPQILKIMCDSLLEDLQENKLKIIYQKQEKSIKHQRNRYNKEQEQQDLQSIFQSSSSPKQQGQQKNTIDCRKIILCLWSFHKLKVKDTNFTNFILKQILRPRIKQMPANIFPLFLSTLWIMNMHHKRIFEQITLQLTHRQDQIMKLDRDKIKMLICMVCKPQLDKKQQVTQQQNNKQKQSIKATHRNLVLWLMQTLVIKYQNKQQFFFPTTAYQILINANQANFIDQYIFSRYISIICSDLSKIESKQVVYLLQIIKDLRRNNSKKQNKMSRNEASTKQILSEQFEILRQNISQNAIKFMNKMNEQHPSRIAFRRMVLSNFIEVPKNIRKKIQFQRKKRTVTHRDLSKINQKQFNKQQKPRYSRFNDRKQKQSR